MAPASNARHLHLTDLPREVQKDIVGHCQQHDLICLSVVSKHFHDLAAAELYRDFHIVFPDEDDQAFDSPIDGLAGGLETLVTSEYNYAKHLRGISLDTLSAGRKAEVAYKPYLYSLSCGKFLNTLLLLTLRKAKALETLRWNIRVELSRPVYKALHDIDTLSHLYIRLQDGPSLYEPPLPLPFSSPTTTPNASTNHLPIIEAPPPAQAFTLPPPPALFYIPPPSTTLPPPLPKPPVRIKAPKKPSTFWDPPTLSGFRKLKTLSILDIDDLDVVPELKSCVRKSQGTLTKLKLSFSHNMAMRARKPPPDSDDSEDPDDEFQVGPVVVSIATQPYDDASGPARTFRAQEERKTQEAVLGRIFDVEPYLAKRSACIPEKEEDEATAEDKTTDPTQDFINSLQAALEKLKKDFSGSGNTKFPQEILNSIQQEILSTIQGTMAKQIDQASKRVSELEDETRQLVVNGTNGEPSTSGANGDGMVETEAAGTSVEQGKSGIEDGQQEEASLFASKVTKGREWESAQDASPDDIIIEEPVEDSSTEEPPEAASSGIMSPDPVQGDESPAVNQSPSKANGTDDASTKGDKLKTLAKRLNFFEIQAEELHKEMKQIPSGGPGPHSTKRVEDAEKQLHEFSESIKAIQHEMSTLAAEIREAKKEVPATAKTEDTDAVLDRISEYTRSTRGLSLRTLSIHLIPIKASVLSRAIDLRVLKKITLLNVGPQAPFWALMTKLNSTQPIALRKIFTDNVCMTFLMFVNGLEELHELFMLERPDKYKPESFAGKTDITKEQITKLVLKKHMKSLVRLMIKNERNSDWDVDEKAMLLICRRGRALEELAVSMGIGAIHTLLQHISGLANLRALHIINLRNDDTCVWVMRETKRFIIDNLSHYPQLKLEWLAIDDDDRVERIVRWKEPPKNEEKKKAAARDKAPVAATSTTTTTTTTNDGQLPALSLDNPDIGSGSDDEDDEENGSGNGGSKIEIMENRFYDVWGVRIFKKEITAGRL